mmetsp:Transcript_10797/g.17677  ORF Transcript_10797/g.17677 Transcript_10797/m.17677 type:complete len:534 (+) Transcript_10797:107-1708(+)
MQSVKEKGINLKRRTEQRCLESLGKASSTQDPEFDRLCARFNEIQTTVERVVIDIRSFVDGMRRTLDSSTRLADSMGMFLPRSTDILSAAMASLACVSQKVQSDFKERMDRTLTSKVLDPLRKWQEALKGIKHNMEEVGNLRLDYDYYRRKVAGVVLDSRKSAAEINEKRTKLENAQRAHEDLVWKVKLELHALDQHLPNIIEVPFINIVSCMLDLIRTSSIVAQPLSPYHLDPQACLSRQAFLPEDLNLQIAQLAAQRTHSLHIPPQFQSMPPQYNVPQQNGQPQHQQQYAPAPTLTQQYAPSPQYAPPQQQPHYVQAPQQPPSGSHPYYNNNYSNGHYPALGIPVPPTGPYKPPMAPSIPLSPSAPVYTPPAKALPPVPLNASSFISKSGDSSKNAAPSSPQMPSSMDPTMALHFSSAATQNEDPKNVKIPSSSTATRNEESRNLSSSSVARNGESKPSNPTARNDPPVPVKSAFSVPTRNDFNHSLQRQDSTGVSSMTESLLPRLSVKDELNVGAQNKSKEGLQYLNLPE